MKIKRKPVMASRRVLATTLGDLYDFGYTADGIIKSVFTAIQSEWDNQQVDATSITVSSITKDRNTGVVFIDVTLSSRVNPSATEYLGIEANVKDNQFEIYDLDDEKFIGSCNMDESAKKTIDRVILDEAKKISSIESSRNVRCSTKTRKTPIKADAADVYENSDDTFEEIFYDVCINDNHNGNYYEREEDAIEIANQYAADQAYADDEITVVMEHYMTDARGEIIDYFDDNGAVVWSSNDAIYDSTKINASAELPENYSDLGYDNLDFAVEAAEAAKAAADILASRMQTVKEMRMDNLDPIEWFSGPEEAEAFGKAMYDLATKLDKLSDNYLRIIEKYANF